MGEPKFSSAVCLLTRINWQAWKQQGQRMVGNGSRTNGNGHGGTRQAINARDCIVLLVFGVRVLQTILRMAMGAMVVFLCDSYDCGPSTKGWLLSAHAAGYCTTQVAGGYLADRFGGRRVVTFSMVAAGASLGATPVAASLIGLQGVAAMQVVMGVAMGPLFPAGVRLLAGWLPAGERAFASTALDSGITLGSLIVVPLSGFLAVHCGWQATFALYGVAMASYAFAWDWLVSESPRSCRYCSSEEQDFLATAMPRKPKQKAKPTAGSFLDCFTYARLWAIYSAHIIFNYSMYFFTSWSAIYYHEVFGLRPQQAGLHLSLPYAVNLAMLVFFNPALDRFMRGRGFSDISCRRAFTCLGFVLPAFFIKLIPLARTPSVATAGFCASLGFMALHPSGFKANYMDVTTSRGGVVSGVGNTVASVGSTVGPLLVAHIREVFNGWTLVFDSVAALHLLAAFVYCACSSTVPIEAAEVEGQAKTNGKRE